MLGAFFSFLLFFGKTNTCFHKSSNHTLPFSRIVDLLILIITENLSEIQTSKIVRPANAFEPNITVFRIGGCKDEVFLFQHFKRAKVMRGENELPLAISF